MADQDEPTREPEPQAASEPDWEALGRSIAARYGDILEALSD